MNTGAIRGLRRSAKTFAIAVAAGGALLSACGAERETTVVRHTTIEQRAAQPPPRMAAISFLDLHGEQSVVDPSKERVVGTIVNHGDKPVSRLSIRVEGLDAGGGVVTSVVTPPIEQTIDPLGGRIQFEAFLPYSSSVQAYHAVALAR